MKTYSEELLEKYLLKKGIEHSYEPFGHDTTNPDFLVSVDGKRLLVEVEEVQLTPSDKAAYRALELAKVGIRKTGGSLDLDTHLRFLRRKIGHAAKQLKPHINTVDHSIVVFGCSKRSMFGLSLQEVEWAVVGNPTIRISFDSDQMTRPQLSFAPSPRGLFRKEGGSFKVHHPYICGFGVISNDGIQKMSFMPNPFGTHPIDNDFAL